MLSFQAPFSVGLIILYPVTHAKVITASSGPSFNQLPSAYPSKSPQISPLACLCHCLGPKPSSPSGWAHAAASLLASLPLLNLSNPKLQSNLNINDKLFPVFHFKSYIYFWGTWYGSKWLQFLSPMLDISSQPGDPRLTLLGPKIQLRCHAVQEVSTTFCYSRVMSSFVTPQQMCFPQFLYVLLGIAMNYLQVFTEFWAPWRSTHL